MSISKLVVVDYDRTLVEPETGLDDAIAASLSRLRDACILVVATANTTCGLSMKCSWQNYFHFAITGSGATVYEAASETPIRQEHIAVNPGQLLENGISFAMQLQSELIFSESYGYTGREPSRQISSAEAQAQNLQCERLFVRGVHGGWPQTDRDMAGRPIRQLQTVIPGITVYQAADATKRNQAEHLRERLGIPENATVAAGDDYEDVDLVNWAQTGYWVGNRTQPLNGDVIRVRDSVALLEVLEHDLGAS